MRALIFLSLLLVSGTAIAQSSYDTGLMPKELMPYAGAVVRNEEITTEVKSLDNVIYHVKRVVTVLNKNGDEEADLAVFYNKSTSVRSLKGIIYDEFGKATQKISSGDFEDLAATDGFSLFMDERVKHYTRAITHYPYTIEFEYEVKAKQSFYFHDWVPNPRSGVAVEKSSYQFICDPDFNLRYKEINLPSKAGTGTNKEGQKTYTWKISNLKARRDEPFSPEWNSMAAKLMLAPDKFEDQDFTGSFANWQQLGKWISDHFLAGREDLPPATVEHVKELTAGIPDPKEKAKKIFEYMQQKTHYISVQVGIGGFRPFPASEVDNDGYGDCKALVNYTKALLKAVGVDSYYCMVEAGDDYKISFENDFASLNQGNHIILCVPFKADTLWSDCTSQTIPFGYLGAFTDDRLVLACTPEGGKLLHTPKYSAADNLEKRKADFIISDAGAITGNIQTEFKGVDYEDRRHIIAESQTDRLKDIRKYYPINNMDIRALEYKQDKSIMPTTFETLNLSARDYGALNNGKLYFLLNSVDRYSEYDIPKQVRNRQNPVYINRGWTEDDNISYALPKGYKLDSEPLNISIEKPFGSFMATISVDGDKLIYKRKLQVKDGTYSKDTYQDVVDFYQSVADADNYNVILAKN
ncbi:MAG TPA: DUF3857 domain-containing protein [Mucilaginibacter sp.]|jgi:hypothetical protein|nr:DUF3857 domain-containing protein [Mucilaginibacter sp.]